MLDQYAILSPYQLAMRGRYEEALARMEDLDQETIRTLKHHQYWIASMGLLKLQRHLHKLDVSRYRYGLY